MPYEVELPNGTIVEGIPDDMPRDEVRKKILSAYPDLEDYKPQATPAQLVAGGGNGILSTIGNVTGSILPGLVTGVGNVLQQPKQLMELAGSKFGVEKENIPDIGYLNTAGKGLESLGQYMMPEAIKKGLESGQQVGDVADLQAQKEFNDSWINKALPQVTELAQKFNFSCVAASAGKIISPSFSLDSSSTTKIGLPFLKSNNASSIVLNIIYYA